MTDIYDIKDVILWFPLNIFNTLVFLIFLISFYIFLKYLFSRKDKNLVVENIEENIEKINYSILLDDVENKYINSDYSIFYTQLSSIIRWILLNKWHKNISKMTYDEIKNIGLDKNIEDIIYGVYFKEYSNWVNDNLNDRKNYISKVRWLI